MSDTGNPYGIDSNGNPTSSGGDPTPTSGAAANPCVSGQTVDPVSGKCIGSTGQTTFVNTAPKPIGPTNIPDPANPGYDTAGYLMGSSVSPNGTLTIPNPTTGKTATTPAGTLNTTFTPTPPAPTPASYLANTSGGPDAPSTPPPPTYQFSPYTGPNLTPFQYATPGTFDAGPTSAAAQSTIMDMLNNTSMSPAVIAQMKETNKDTLLAGQQQQQQSILQDAASRGVLGGGTTAANVDTLDQSTMGDISSAYRTIDINAAATQEANQAAAVAAANQYQSQLLSSFLGTQDLDLSTEQAQDASTQAADTFDLNSYSTQEALKDTAANQAFQAWATSQGIDLSFLSNAQTNGLNIAKFLSGATS